jgi:hypothetical protein
MKTVSEHIADKLKRLSGHPKSREERELISDIERVEKTMRPLIEADVALQDKAKREVTQHACEQYRRRAESESFITVENFPDDVPPKEAIRALLAATFHAERKEHLDRLRAESQAKLAPLRKELLELQARLAKVQAELQQG